MSRLAHNSVAPQMQAYCDGELDAVSATEFERRLANDASLQDQYGRLISLRHLLRSLPQFDMPSGLEHRMQLKLEQPMPRHWRRSPLRAASLRNRRSLRLISNS
jgi:anti-sigma factor RsiW